jgi:hypothetical protein
MSDETKPIFISSAPRRPNGPKWEGVDYLAIRDARVSRQSDLKFRTQSGFRRAGFLYIQLEGDVRPAPRSLFVDRRGVEWVCLGPSLYVQRSGLVEGANPIPDSPTGRAEIITNSIPEEMP